MINFDTRLSPEAYFDCLAVVAQAPRSARPFTINEMHLFSYLGCVLALFNGKPIADWGYRYGVTTEGFPFSPDYEMARSILLRKGYLTVNPAGLIDLTPKEADREFSLLAQLEIFRSRCQWLKLATECTLALPLGSIRHALDSIPSIRMAASLGQKQASLDDDEVDLLYEEYQAITQALDADVDRDPISPVILWLSARIMRGNKEGERWRQLAYQT